MRKLVAILVSPAIFIITGLSLLPVVALLLVRLLSGMNIPTDRIDRPILFPIVLVLFLVSAVISGRIANDHAWLVGALGNLFSYIFVFLLLLPSLFPLVPFASGAFDTLSIVFLVLVIITGAIGGMTGGSLREENTNQHSPMLRFLGILLLGVSLSLLAVVTLLALFPAAPTGPRVLETPIEQSTGVLASAASTAPASVMVQTVMSPIPSASPRPPAINTVLPTATPRPIATATLAAPIFRFVNLRWEPAAPTWGNDVVFYAKFNNSFSEPKYLSWRIEICTPDCPNWTKLMFQTDYKQEFVPPGGMFEVASKPWPLRGKGGLQTYPIRFVHIAQDGTRTGEQIFYITVNP